MHLIFNKAKGGITTGGGEKECKTLKSQMKKGLSVIVNKTNVKPTISKKKSVGDEIASTTKVIKKNTNASIISTATTQLRSKANGPTGVCQVPTKNSKR